MSDDTWTGVLLGVIYAELFSPSIGFVPFAWREWCKDKRAVAALATQEKQP